MRVSLSGGILLLCALLEPLAGCGADVSGAAATTAAMEAQAASQAKAQEAQIQKDLNAAMQAGQQATASAAEQ